MKKEVHKGPRETGLCISKFTMHHRESIREAYKKQSLNNAQFVIVLDDNHDVMGIVTDGDFRRAIWNSVSLDDSLGTIVNRDFVSFQDGGDLGKAKDIFLSSDVRQIPVLRNRKLVDIIFKNTFSVMKEASCSPAATLGIPVVIMAGGKGTRLDPFTRILPKPLIPIGEKPVIEVIMDTFAEQGVHDFYVTLNHKAKMIKAFFEEASRNYTLHYIEEERPLGTAGALRLLPPGIRTPIIVANCDTVIQNDYAKIILFHQKGGYAVTIVGSMQHHVVPYGVCEIKNGGELIGLKEKPEYDFIVNTGMYVLEPKVLRLIPRNRKFDMTDLIALLEKKGHAIGVYPIPGNSWIDIGRVEEYIKSVDKLRLFEQVKVQNTSA